MIPSGTLIFTNIVGPRLQNMVDLEWTHVLISLRCRVYEATWPRVRCTCDIPAQSFLLNPKSPYTESQIDKMVQYAVSQIGRPYNWRGFFQPCYYGKTYDIYCSQYACNILRAGEVPIPYCAGYSPDTLLAAMRKL